ncbi:E3 ubiquitin-protein ligase RNF4 isoform X2 [Brachypodium distachyon]|uniref:RING-type domain-containing protein n=1 Tax=Brachypodium distachyon TaxID=15368 RepID=A0A0Q3FPH3_BRADI|nr:E3 ubiquitin-protein ligase RNF4 isoform X2 [Brachypodium distachyon]KQK01087.1 hypothetical protein BRADI_3g53775v3 [Brachypodium distachyon]|eukprot:XP_024316246.1 E3 ubiquitin-protein ligase RNF4 isoform X2 [Brachypodium distachyon]
MSSLMGWECRPCVQGRESPKVDSDSMSTVAGAQSASRGQSQDGSADKVVVNLDGSSSVAGNRRGVSTSTGSRASPIDVEALHDELQIILPSQVPPLRWNRRSRMQLNTYIDLEVDADWEGNKRQRPTERGEGSSLQSNNVVETKEEPVKVAPKEPTYTCPVCWGELVEPSSTICGHIFCTDCIKQSLEFQKKCPTCRKILRKNNFHRIYLPNSHVEGPSEACRREL